MNSPNTYQLVGPSLVITVYLAILAIIFALGLVGYIFNAICYMKLFQKADEPGWMAWVPFLNSYMINKLVFGNGWLFLIQFITFIPYIGSLVYLVYFYYLQWKITEVYGGGIGTFLGMIFLRIIFLPYLAFGPGVYHEEKVDFLNGMIAHA